jgi:hypothetical protein
VHSVLKLWIDDYRKPPDNTWEWVKTVEGAIHCMSKYTVSVASLDHDLGDGPTGYDLTKWMVENNIWPQDAIYLHTGNPVGRINMQQEINVHSPFVVSGNSCRKKEDCPGVMWN